MGIFQWEDFQNHQRLELPFHNWKSPPNSREMISFFFPGLPIETPSAPNPKHVMRPIPNELNPSNWKQPCIAFGLGYFHHWAARAKTHILPRKTFLWNFHLIQTENWNWLLATPKIVLSYEKLFICISQPMRWTPVWTKQPAHDPTFAISTLIKPMHLL